MYEPPQVHVYINKYTCTHFGVCVNRYAVRSHCKWMGCHWVDACKGRGNALKPTNIAEAQATGIPRIARQCAGKLFHHINSGVKSNIGSCICQPGSPNAFTNFYAPCAVDHCNFFGWCIGCKSRSHGVNDIRFRFYRWIRRADLVPEGSIRYLFPS